MEIYFSVIQRKVVSPNDFTDLTEIEQRLAGFEQRYNRQIIAGRRVYGQTVAKVCSPSEWRGLKIHRDPIQ